MSKICILGAGVMGHSIGQVFVSNGYQVSIRDIKEKYLQNAKNDIERRIWRDVTRGRLGEDDAQEILGRISYSVDLDDALEGAVLVIEAVPEIMDLKKKVLAEVSEKVDLDAVIASNTSSLSINEISNAIYKPERFIGMHFFNPPTHMRLIELIPSRMTNQETIEKVKEYSGSIGKTPIVAKDAPGFIVNRILVTYLNEAARQLDKNYTISQIDSSMMYNAGMPLGPFQLMDLIGLDIIHHILHTFVENIGKDYVPHESIVRLFNEGKHGRKTGEGYYIYDKPVTPDKAIKNEFDHTILLSVLVREAEKVVDEGIAEPVSVDTAMKLGANIPQGPFEIKEEYYGI